MIHMHIDVGAASRIDAKAIFRIVVIAHSLSDWFWQFTLRECVTKDNTGVTGVASCTCHALIILSTLMCLAVPECFPHAYVPALMKGNCSM
jgi:hypothetical protein